MARTRVVAYLRVSTSKQADDGQSLDAQREKVDLYARLHELDVVEVLVDAGESASSLERPGLRRALSMLGPQADALLVVKLDRLTRSVRDLGELLDRYFDDGGFGLLSVSDHVDTRTPEGRLVLNVLGSVSQWEREATAARTSAVMQHMSSTGLYVGGEPPYAYRVVDGRLELDEREKPVLDLILAQADAGASFRAIARDLKARGHASRTGRAFDATQVGRVVRRARTAAESPSGRNLPGTSATFRPSGS